MSERIPTAPLEELATITMGQSPESAAINANERGLPFLQGCAEFGHRFPVARVHCASPLRIAKAGSTLISVRAPVGTTNVADQEYCIGRGLGGVLAKPGRADDAFLLNAIQHSVGYLHRRSQGSTFLAIGSGDLRSLPIAAPGITEQQRIAEVLTTVDEAIEQAEALIAKTQQIKVGLIHDLFTRGVTPDGQLRPPRSEAPHLYKESPLGWIPKEWTEAWLSQYLEPTNGIKPGPFGSSLTKDTYTSAGFRVYGQEQVIAGTFEVGDYYISESKYAEMRTFEVLEGDVLLSLVGTVGCVLVAEPPFERGIINPRLMRLRPDVSRALPRFVKYLLLTDGVRRQLNSLAGGGTMPVINGKVVRRLRAPYIDPNEQSQIVRRLDEAEESAASNTVYLVKLRQIRAGLMHDLLTGRVRVSVPEAKAVAANV